MYRPPKQDLLAYVLMGALCSLLAYSLVSLSGDLVPPRWVGFVGGMVGGAATCYLISDHVFLNMYHEIYQLKKLIRRMTPWQPTPITGPACDIAGDKAIKLRSAPWSDKPHPCSSESPPQCS